MHRPGYECGALLKEYGEYGQWAALRPWDGSACRRIEERCQCLRIAKELGVAKDYFDGKRILEIGPALISFMSTVPAPVKVGIEPLAMRFCKAGMLPDNDIVYIACRGESVPLPGDRFDLVLSRNNLDHVDNPRDVVLEAYRLLRPGGEFALIVHLADKPSPTEPHVFTESGLLELMKPFKLKGGSIEKGGKIESRDEFRGIFTKAEAGGWKCHDKFKAHCVRPLVTWGLRLNPHNFFTKNN